MNIMYKNVYQNNRGDISWEGKQSALYNFKYEPGGCVKGLEFLSEDHRWYLEVAKYLTPVGPIPDPACIDACNLDELNQASQEAQAFITRCKKRGDVAPAWIIQIRDQFMAKAAEMELLEAERQAEADRRTLDKLVTAVEKIGKPQKSVTVPDEIPPDYSDPVVTRIRNSGDPCPKKLTDLYLHSLKYKAWTGPDVGVLINETSDAIRNALFRMRKKAADLKKKEDEMEG